MRKPTLKIAAAALAMTAMVQPQIAQAQAAEQACVEQQVVSDAMVYATPILAEAFMDKCSSELSSTGFMATKGDEFIGRFDALQDTSWPGAMRLLQNFGSSSGKIGELSSMISTLPEEAIRPFIDAILLQRIHQEIKVADCGKIERGIELISPLPPENIGGLMSFIFEMSDVKNPEICPYESE